MNTTENFNFSDIDDIVKFLNQENVSYTTLGHLVLNGKVSRNGLKLYQDVGVSKQADSDNDHLEEINNDSDGHHSEQTDEHLEEREDSDGHHSEQADEHDGQCEESHDSDTQSEPDQPST